MRKYTKYAEYLIRKHTLKNFIIAEFLNITDG